MSRADRVNRFAVIQVWEKGMGFATELFPNPVKGRGEYFEHVNWFDTEGEANEFFKKTPQGQTAKDGEVYRFVVKIVRGW